MWAAALTRFASRGPIRTISTAGRGWTSGGQVDSNRPQPLVQRFKRELEYFALGVSELGDVARIGRVQRARDQRKALHERLLDQRRVALRVFSDRLLQHLDPEAHVARLVARDGGEAAIEAAVGAPQLTHRLELESLPGQGDRRLDDDVINRDALDERVEVLRVARQALGSRGQAVVEKGVV